jgi:hypothetical protein
MPEAEPQEKKASRPGRRPRPGDESSDAPPQRKVVEGGWGFGGDSSSKAAQGKGVDTGGGSKGEAAPAGAKPGRRRGVDSFAVKSEGDDAAEQKRINKFDDDGDDILVIPDLEEDLKEDLTTQVAVAPKNNNIKVQSMRELDHAIKYTLPTTMHNGLDLSLLTESLSPHHAVVEDDDTWEFDVLLQQVSQDMQVERDEIEEEKAKVAASAEQQ